MRVIDGGCTRSAAASSRGVSGPRRSSVAKVASWVSVREVSARSERIRRASRMTARRSELARAVGTEKRAHRAQLIRLANDSRHGPS
jgi:hypothetical protein